MKLGIANLYQKTSEILELSSIARPKGYETERMHDLIDLVDRQISTYYPRLRPLLMPRVEGGKVLPPERWKVQKYLQQFSRSKPVKYKNVREESTDLDTVLSNDYVSKPKEADKTKKLDVKGLYDTTVEILGLVDSGFIPDANKERVQSLMDLMEYNISEFYPNLRPIFMPQVEERNYQFGSQTVIVAPERWGEPTLNSSDPREPGLLKQYIRTISSSDKIFTHGGEQNEPVYTGIVNPDIKRKIENRSMKEAEYYKILRTLTRSLKPSTPALQPATSELAVRDIGELALREESQIEKRLDEASTGLLAIESGFTYGTVSKHRKKGLSGQDIVSEKYAIDSMKTSGELVHRLREHGIPEEQWSDLVDVSRDIGVSVSKLLGYMGDLGIEDVEDISSAIEHMHPEVTMFAERRKLNESYVWYMALEIYSTEGRGNPDRSIDILTGQLMFSLEYDNEFEEDQKKLDQINHILDS